MLSNSLSASDGQPPESPPRSAATAQPIPGELADAPQADVRVDKLQPGSPCAQNSTRAQLLAGLASPEEIAAALGVSVFTVRYRLELPFIRVGSKRLYDIAKCRAALLGCLGRRHQTPRRGRPRKTI